MPPAWTEVKICMEESGHIQAIGRDEKGRLQYRYHDEWVNVRDAVKTERLLRFGHALPRLRGASRRTCGAASSTAAHFGDGDAADRL